MGGVGDTDLIALLAAGDLYLTTQRRQAVDCGIAQALAMGLPVVASNIAAHRAYPVETAPDVPALCRLIGPHAARWLAGDSRREPVILPGADPLSMMADTIANDLERDSTEHWI